MSMLFCLSILFTAPSEFVRFSQFVPIGRNGRRCCDYLRVNDLLAAVSVQIGVAGLHAVVAIGRPDERGKDQQGFAGGNSQNEKSKKQGERDEKILPASQVNAKSDAAKEKTAGGGEDRILDYVEGFQLVGDAEKPAEY